jgi:hypothetical protein
MEFAIQGYIVLSDCNEGRQAFMTDFTIEDYVKYRIGHAIETIEEVRVRIGNKFWNTAINRMYYACYYAVSASLGKR